MTDPELADATSIEPITPAIVARIIEQERAARPKAKLVLLPAMGGLSAGNYGAITGAPPATTRRDLAKLMRIGVLRSTGARKGTRFWIQLI